jgi:hypothetical protein
MILMTSVYGKGKGRGVQVSTGAEGVIGNKEAKRGNSMARQRLYVDLHRNWAHAFFTLVPATFCQYKCRPFLVEICGIVDEIGKFGKYHDSIWQGGVTRVAVALTSSRAETHFAV